VAQVGLDQRSRTSFRSLFQDELFYDREGGGYFSNAAGDPSILLRMKEDYDGAEPSGNSVAASNLLRLSHMISGDAGEEYKKHALHTMVSGKLSHWVLQYYAAESLPVYGCPLPQI
jgi:uncharacterized protein YyaL (SSP411 family)